MSKGSAPAAFLFDMDGLLIDSERLAQASFVESVAPCGVDEATAKAFFLTLVGTSEAVTHGEVSGFIPQGHDVRDVKARWSDSFAARLAKGVPLMPTVRETLERLYARGALMAVVTSTHGAHARANLARAGILDFFAHVTAGDEVSANKPDPAPYLETSAALGLAAEDCAAFEDSDRGVASAVGAGCRVVQIPDLRPQGTPLPDLGQSVARTFSEAVSLFDVPDCGSERS